MNKKLFTAKLPGFLGIQKFSFCWFLTKGLPEELNTLSSIFYKYNDLEVQLFLQEYILKAKKNQTPLVCKQNRASYMVRVYLPIKIFNYQTREKKKNQSIFIAQIPLMTPGGSFIVNGCERVIVNQIMRCPGLYFKKQNLKSGLFKTNFLPTLTFIPLRGSWINLELDVYGYWIRFEKKPRCGILRFLYHIGLTDTEIKAEIHDINFLLANSPAQSFFQVRNPDNFLSESDLNELSPKLFNKMFYDLGRIGRKRLNQKLGANVSENLHVLSPKDICAAIDYFYELDDRKYDDIDDLENRRIRSVGELLQTQLQVGVSRLHRIINEKLKEPEQRPLLGTLNIINPKPITAAFKEFFGSSQLSQYMDQINPLSELSHKRRITSLGPGGLSSDRITLCARDIHPTQYGRICPIESPEGKNVGLLGTLACLARVDLDGSILVPFRKIFHGKILREQPLIYLSSFEEQQYQVLAPDVRLNTAESNLLNESGLVVAKKGQDLERLPSTDINLIGASPLQIISVAVSLVPFLEHDDANRVLMGATMQRQAVPLVYPQTVIVGTGTEPQVAYDSQLNLIAFKAGIVTYVSSKKIIVKSLDSKEIIYFPYKYEKSNQNTCLNQKPNVWVGEHILRGQIIASASGTKEKELALGQNLAIAYLPWEGYNFEDSIIVSDKLVYDNLFSSIHIERHETEVRQTTTGPETLTRDLPFISVEELKDLDKNGIISQGAYVKPETILIGKVAPLSDFQLIPEVRLLRAIFAYKQPKVKDVSLRVPAGIFGKVLDVKVFFSKNKNQKKTADPYFNALIRVFIVQIRKLKVGDKIAGRHGNKGVISKILARQDMPFLPDGTTIDVILNPLGVPSRMNVGQIYECLLGLAGDFLNKRFKILPFDEMHQKYASRILVNEKLKTAASYCNEPWLFNSYYPGKVILTDGRTGDFFDNPVLVGRSYLVKLIHLVDDKIHARSTGPYSLVTQQPVGGKSQKGGQRFGEMEVWALEAFGAAYTLQELLTVKADDMQGRNDILNSIIQNDPLPKSGIPESFKVLIRELHALGLDIKMYKLYKKKKSDIQVTEIDLMQTYEKSFN